MHEDRMHEDRSGDERVPRPGGSGFRPRNEVFDHAGARVEIVDPRGVLGEAVAGPVRLTSGAPFPPPVRDLSITVSCIRRNGDLVHVLEAEVLTGTDGFARRVLADLGERSVVSVATTAAVAAMAVTSPVGALAVGLVAHRLGLLADGRRAGPVGKAGRVAEPKALLPAGSSDPELAVEITGVDDPPRDSVEGTVTLRATVPSDLVHPAYLRAFTRRCLLVVQGLSGGGDDPLFLAGRGFQFVRVIRRRQGTAPSVVERAAERAAVTARSAIASVSGGRTQAGSGPLTTVSGEHLPPVTLDDVGGLRDIVAALREVAISFRHPEVMARWGARRPQGILLYGPPGTGKTMLAKALAQEIGATLREIRTPEILDKWLGGSERNIKNIFADARRHREPLVLLFDEFDSIISYTGGSFDAANHAVNAVAGVFKQEMNTLVEENPNVIVVATTNFPDRVDDSLVRSGRFDLKMAVPPPDPAARADIFTKILRGLAERHERGGFTMFADDVDVAELALLTSGLTGADAKELLRRVQLAKALDEARSGAPVDPITQHDLATAIADMRRSGI